MGKTENPASLQYWHGWASWASWGKKVVSPRWVACVSQESGAEEEFDLLGFKNWRRKRVLGQKTVSRAQKHTDWIGPQMNCQKIGGVKW
jgi:hypothetical protein